MGSFSSSFLFITSMLYIRFSCSLTRITHHFYVDVKCPVW